MQCSNNLKQIALALQNYEHANQSFPNECYKTSFYTNILPHIEQQAMADLIAAQGPTAAQPIPLFLCPSRTQCQRGNEDRLRRQHRPRVVEQARQLSADSFRARLKAVRATPRPSLGEWAWTWPACPLPTERRILSSWPTNCCGPATITPPPPTRIGPNR